MQQTKGYETLKGKIFGLEKEPRLNPTGSMRSLTLKVQTNKDNSKLVQVGKWTNSKLTIKIKGKDMEDPIELNEQEAIDEIRKVFKEGDSVFINTRIDTNTYSKRIDSLVNQIYIQSEEIDFSKEDFQETNSINQAIIITEKPEREDLKVGVVDYQGNMIEVETKLLDADVKEYFIDNVKVGDLLQVTLKSVNKPNYVEGVASEGRKTLKGKTVGASKGRKIDGYINYLEIVDVDIDKTESRKYEREEIRQALEGNQKNNKQEDKKIEDKPAEDDLPF
ncbi:MAG: hypothetical protein ACRCX8_06855 [Sarcina sp.]